MGATIKYLRYSTSGAAGNGLGNMIKLLRAAAGISLRTTIKYLRGATGIDLGTTIKYLQKPLNYIGLPDFRYSDPTYPHNRSLAPKVWKTGNLNPVKKQVPR